MKVGLTMEWYKDETMEIIFDKAPIVRMSTILPSMTALQKQTIEKYPFVCLQQIEVTIKYKDNTYKFSVPKGYRWDGATIPRIFWRLIGAKTDPRFLIPSMIHDVLCENKHYVDYNRYLADKVFERLLFVAGVPAFTRWLMFHSVDNFQKFNGWKKELVKNE